MAKQRRLIDSCHVWPLKVYRSSSELIGHVDLTDSYEIWPKCSLVINPQKCVRLF